MKKENKKLAKELVYFSTLGLQVAFAIVIGYFLGKYLDGKFRTSPWLTYIFLVFGIIAGFKNIGLAIKRVEKADKD
ncbi:MAG: AtpZ/AtpI family protein, partial [Desulfobacterales bacterium]|nr:AtpZ/AtpI family protein [Desulfobacterales bacterium]